LGRKGISGSPSRITGLKRVGGSVSGLIIGRRNADKDILTGHIEIRNLDGSMIWKEKRK
jgi:hypothetical protein